MRPSPQQLIKNKLKWREYLIIAVLLVGGWVTFTWFDSIYFSLIGKTNELADEQLSYYLRNNLTGFDLPIDKYYYTPKMVGHNKVVLTNKFTAEELDKVSKFDLQMRVKEAAFLIRKMSTANSYFEFGCSTATQLACSLGDKKRIQIWCVDSDSSRIDSVKSSRCILEGIKSKRIHLMAVNVGKINNGGYQVSSSRKNLWPRYSNAIENIINHANETISVVFVAGQFRIASVLNTFLLQPKTVVLLYGFYSKTKFKKYLPILNVADIIDGADTLVQLKRKEAVNDSIIRTMMDVYKYISD